MPNAAICVRVSPRPAENVRYSPEIQESQCREWCEANGHTVVKVIPDILVSGGSKKRFDSVFRALDEYEIDVFVVADLSRWTRDTPTRFWAIKAVLEDRGIQLVSVNEPYLNSDAPFTATITTAKVEANYLERMTLKRKVKEGLARARAQGKHLGRAPFGWRFHRVPCETCGPGCATPLQYTHDDELIISLFSDYAGGESARSIAARYGVRNSVSVRDIIRAQAQEAIVPADIRARALARAKSQLRGHRIDAKIGNLYRGMLHCPFCGRLLVHHQQRPGNYGCRDGMRSNHPWTYLSARRWVTPVVRSAVWDILFPDTPVQPPAPKPMVDTATQRDRLSEAWIKGRLSQATYDKLLADLDRIDLEQSTPPATPARQLEITRALQRADFDDLSVEGASRLNEILREVIQLEVHENRVVTVTLTDTAQRIASRGVLSSAG